MRQGVAWLVDAELHAAGQGDRHQSAPALILDLAARHEAMITVEEGAVGGFGSHVSQLLAEEGVFDNGFKFRSMVLPDTFIDQASPAQMYEVAKLQANDIEAKVLQVLGIGQISGLRA